jgi:hypothetical protein
MEDYCAASGYATQRSTFALEIGKPRKGGPGSGPESCYFLVI